MNLKKIKRVVLIAGALFALIFAISTLLLVMDGLNDHPGTADVGIVPGSMVEPSGVPSARLRARLDKTIELYNRGFFPNVIVSGGVGREGFDEAAVMKDYLVEKGIPRDRILMDSEGATTYMTARNASILMKQNNWRSAFLISQYFHISRTKLALRRFGITTLYSAHAQYFEMRDLYSIPREVFGYGAYLLKSYD